MPQQPMSREARLAEWQRHGGLSNDEIQFFQKHPEMVDHPQITGLAVNQAKQAGYERGTDAHLAFVEKAFNARVEHMMREQAQAANPAMQATPKFFAPARSAPSPSSIVSAPVSREIPTSSGERLRPRGQVKLTAAEVEAARISGITPEEYAKQKIRKAQRSPAANMENNISDNPRSAANTYPTADASPTSDPFSLGDTRRFAKWDRGNAPGERHFQNWR